MNPSMIPGHSGPRTLLSIFPIAQSLTLRHEGYKTYELPAVKKGEHALLAVNDTFSWNRDFSKEEFMLYPAPIPGQVVAENLIQAWAHGKIGTSDGLGPGIILLEGTKPTPAELELANSVQESYFRHLIYEADQKFIQEGGLNITDLHRVAANWMGLNDRQWIKPIVEINLVNCPACAEQIRAAAKVCKHCHTNIPEFLKTESDVITDLKTAFPPKGSAKS